MRCCEADILLIDLTDDAVDSIFAWLVIRIQQAIRVSVETLSSQLLLETRRSHLKAHRKDEHYVDLHEPKNVPLRHLMGQRR